MSNINKGNRDYLFYLVMKLSFLVFIFLFTVNLMGYSQSNRPLNDTSIATRKLLFFLETVETLNSDSMLINNKVAYLGKI